MSIRCTLTKSIDDSTDERCHVQRRRRRAETRSYSLMSYNLFEWSHDIPRWLNITMLNSTVLYPILCAPYLFIPLDSLSEYIYAKVTKYWKSQILCNVTKCRMDKPWYFAWMEVNSCNIDTIHIYILNDLTNLVQQKYVVCNNNQTYIDSIDSVSVFAQCFVGRFLLATTRGDFRGAESGVQSRRWLGRRVWFLGFWRVGDLNMAKQHHRRADPP